MSITRLRINLKNSKNAQPSISDGGAISSAYSQSEQLDQPAILYQENTIPLLSGIRPSTLLPQSLNYNFVSSMNNSVVIHSELATDIFSNVGPVVLQITQLNNTVEFYMRPNTVTLGSKMIRIMTARIPNNAFLHKRTTLFQNRTLMLATANDAPTVSLASGSDVLGVPNGFWEFDFVNTRVKYSEITGINTASEDIQGITSHENYVIYFSKDTVYWSNPLDPKDFTPALGGGGQASIAEARGAIITVIPYYNGLMVYCADNIVSMTFSGDTSNPWIFREVPNSAGLYISNSSFHSVPLACINEQQQVQYAMLSTGLHAVTENGAAKLPEDLNALITSNYVPRKEKGKSTIIYDNLNTVDFPITLLQNMYSFGSHIFFIVGKAGVPSEANRMYIYNIESRAWGTIVGNWRSVHKQATLDTLSSSNTDALQAKPRVIPEHYVLLEFNATGASSVLDAYGLSLQSRGKVTDLDVVRESEIIVGSITANVERSTILHSISFNTNDDISKDDESHRLRVYAFDVESQNGDTPVEFTYNPADNKYYGYIEGFNVKILLVGKTFYLTTMEVEVEVGGVY